MITHPEDIDAIIDQIEAERAMNIAEYDNWQHALRCKCCQSATTILMVSLNSPNKNKAEKNVAFCEWLRHVFKCPESRDISKGYQATIRSRDLKICGVNSPLCE